MLAYEMCNQLEDKLFLGVQPHDERDGALLLRTLSLKITQISVDKIAVLHERFSKPQSCRSQEGPALALRQRKEDLDELQAAESATAQATVASSLRTIMGRIHELNRDRRHHGSW